MDSRSLGFRPDFGLAFGKIRMVPGRDAEALAEWL